MNPSESVWRERGLRDAVLAGDEAAWKVLYDGCFESLSAYVHCRTGYRAGVTEDILQDAWLIAVRRVRRFDPERGSFEGWLKGIADKVLRNHRRRLERRHRAERHPSVSGQTGDTVELVSSTPRPREGVELAEEIALALTALPARYQAVLKAKYEEELPVADIAARWGESAKTIESLLSRARAAFRETYRRLAGG